MGLNVQGSSALPYNITTGFDTNGDTVFNDRAAGVERNSAPRRDAVDREHAPQQVDRPRRRALRPAEHADAAAAAATSGGAMTQRVGGGPAVPAAATARRWW